jgi:RNA polymerase sigma-70 factor (ECF subfamily)
MLVRESIARPPPTHALRQYGEDELDRSLLRRIALGDRAAFNDLHARYRQRVARFVSRRTRRPEIVDEITNDTLLVVWRSAEQFRGASKVSSWIMGIAHRLSCQNFRDQIRQRACDDIGAQRQDEAHDPWSESELSESVTSALSQLPAAQRTVLQLAHVLGHSCEEIAKRMNCPVNTVKTRMFHGRRKLRKLLVRS